MAAATANGGAPAAQIPNLVGTLREAVEVAGIFPRNGPDPSARSWGHDASGKTFGAQHKIPKQPLPSLQGSCQRYLDAVRPLQSEEEHAASVAAVKTFLDGEGPILQAQLKEYDDTHLNYFENYCYEAFLGDSSPVVLNSNAFAAFTPDPDPKRNDQITRAAALVRSALEFSNAIREDRFPLEDARGVPQCMNQYWWLFGVTRVPEDDGGRLRMDADARHIIVLCRGQIYRLNVLEEDTFRIVDEKHIAARLQHIVDDARKLSSDSAARTSVGAFTTENQRVWARCRKELVHGSVRNGRNIGAIDSSLFALCLDDSSPEGDEEICKNMICGTTSLEKDTLSGTCLNRWYDKLAVIVCRNGAAGMNFEHTCTDGSADIRMACEIYKGSLSSSSPSPASDAQSDGHSTNGSTPASGGGATAGLKKLEWDIGPEVASSLQSAQTHLVDRIHAHQLATLRFDDYGKAFIKAAGVSPDAYFQMILHAAYYSISGQVGNGFEPVLTRSFLHGRTDVARTLTPACAAFARVYNDETAAPAVKVEALRTAAAAHVAKFKDCAQGNSHHRHLYVLQLLWKRRRATLQANQVALELPATTIFTDPGWARLGTTVLMGSNVDNPYIAYAGFGPPSADGYTVCYYIRDNMMAFSVNSRNGRARELTDAIEQTCKAVRTLIENVKGTLDS